MTDKHINTCEFLNICQTDCNGTLEDTEMCHCYELYKQLKRAENQIVDLNKMVEAKEQECEKLAKECEIWKNQVLTTDDETITVQITQQQFEEYNQLKGIIKKYEECNKYLVEENGKTYTRLEYKLLKTLAEIKEIALGVRNYLDCPSPKDVRYEMDIILQKVSECEGKDA